jgi:hypothetical protein
MGKPPEPGIQTCHKCRWKFVSPDPERIRRCSDCKQTEETHELRIAKLGQIAHAVSSFRNNT